MALPEFSFPVPDNAPSPLKVPTPLPLSVSGAALSRLPALHDESRLALRRAGLMARAVPAAGALLLLGTVVAMFGGGGLAPTFLWCLLVCGGVAAVLVSHLKAASVFKDLAGSTADMRAILLYLGAAWGLGAFLALAPQAGLLIAFAIVPMLAVGLLLGDLRAILAFGAPVLAASLAALVLRCASMTGAGILLALSGALALGIWQRTRTGTGNPAALFTISGLR
jgi:hypothetical protein